LGIYFVTEQLDTTRLHDKYGVTAFPLDYPNAWDRRLGRTGDGIWVHGVDPRGGTRGPLDTDGCIALPNERLLELAPTFKANVTPVLIATELSWAEPGAVAAVRVALEQAVLRWAESLEQGDMYAWLSSYDDAFRHWGMNKEEWSAFSLETVGRRPIEEVTVSDLLLLGDPVEAGLYLSRFRLEITESDSRKVISMRRIYWRRSESGALTIVAEDSG
jgi:murein L,D-transpeptidase YafK